jgi:hypothetical protein
MRKGRAQPRHAWHARAMGRSGRRVREVYDTLNRHDGNFYLARAAGFAAVHQAQGDRLDFGRLFKACRRFPFLVGAAMKTALSTGRSTSRKNGWVTSASRSSVCRVVTSPRMSSRQLWPH